MEIDCNMNLNMREKEFSSANHSRLQVYFLNGMENMKLNQRSDFFSIKSVCTQLKEDIQTSFGQRISQM